MAMVTGKLLTPEALDALKALEMLTPDQLSCVTEDHVMMAAYGLARYAREHFALLVPVSSEIPSKVQKQVKDAMQLELPYIYACALAAGSNWYETDAYTSSRGYSVTTAEADMMTEKAHYFYARYAAAGCRQPPGPVEKCEDTVLKMLDAKRLHRVMHEEMAPKDIPKYARNPDRWPAYLKYLGRGLPFDPAWDTEWFEYQKEGFQASMQTRKLGSGCIFYKILSKALEVDPDLICAETNDDTRYGIGKKTEDALQMVRQGHSAEEVCGGGQNVLGRAHSQAARCSEGTNEAPP
ncbi:MAG: hypothetical protein L7S63_08410 [Flavobacteriales bacterium]|jgi:hypothetical protein|nr:hypothetical protein [Flavobacteriales bacterium]